jgi:hypothetical protein
MRVTAALAALAFVLGLATAPAASAASAPVCIEISPETGLCLVTAGGVGGGTGSSGGPSSGSGSAGSSVCHWDTANGHAPGVVPCSTSSGAVWNGFCYLSLMVPQPPQRADGGGVWNGHTDGAIYQC